jgi:hypothetical protein
MSKADQTQILAETLEKIQTLFTELRQTEALAMQVHEMVVMKRNRLDRLMQDYLQQATPGEVSAVAAPMVAPKAPAIEPPKPAPIPDMAMTPHGNYGAPRDLLQGQPTPSAQHVLESLNRLMTGIKDISAKKATAA